VDHVFVVILQELLQGKDKRGGKGEESSTNGVILECLFLSYLCP
jgi:hypothetical protein